MIRFEVLGTPTPQGSKTRMPNGAMVEGRSKNQRDAHSSWRTAVADHARAVAATHGKLDGPLMLQVTFRFAMPASARKADYLRGWSWKTSAPDLDKLVRSVGDALKIGGLITDDSRIVELRAVKEHSVTWTGAIIELEPWPEERQ